MATLKASTYKDHGTAVEHYLDRVDTLADQARYIAPSLKEIHDQKVTEAKAGRGSLLKQEAKVLGVTIKALAQLILDKYAERQALIERVEVARMYVKTCIRNAATPAEMHQLVKEFESKLNQ
ncbi:hypothetical protein [Vreelandella venusta]|uniref:hypothetical protein n=1 Tax=Vreelandella venusta TaxID=44935 RepID=UPI001168FD6B|nr:hypothetical protein [Halomonas venusta]GEK52329.1 hypothetical protein HVE01_30500 [Halomonas venusta]